MGAKICLYHEKKPYWEGIIGAKFRRAFPDLKEIFLVGLFEIIHKINQPRNASSTIFKS